MNNPNKPFRTLLILVLAMLSLTASAQQRRPVDSKHPMWLVHIDVWNNADPQKIIDLIPEDVRPYVCFNLSLSCHIIKCSLQCNCAIGAIFIYLCPIKMIRLTLF